MPPQPESESRIPRVILRASLRLIFLRSVLVSSSVCAAYSIWALLSLSFDQTVVAAVVFTVFTFSHHIVNALGPQFIPLPVCLDLAITLCEIGFYLFVLTLPRAWLYTARSRWFPKRAVVALLCAWLLAIALIALFTLKLLHVIRAPAKIKYLAGPVDISKSTEPKLDYQGNPKTTESVGKYLFRSLFGRKIWEPRILGEGPWVIVLRAILSFMIIIILVVYGFYQITLMPISEMGMLPNKEFRATNIPSTFTSSVPLAWNLIMVWRRHLGAPKRLVDVTAVKPVWRANATYPQNVPQCELVPDPFGQSNIPASDPFSDPWVTSLNSRDTISGDYDVVVYRCPPRIEVENPNSFQVYEDYRTDTRPDLELTVNFTELAAPGENLGTHGDVILDSVQVFLGLSNRTHDTITTTRPTPLFPGLNLLGVASLAVRQRLEPPELSTFGFDVQKTFMIAEMAYTSNPFATAAQPSVSTLYITAELSDMTEWRIIKDFRDKSVLNGLSATGGLGSLLNTFLSILLGTSLLRALFRTKPFSLLGLVHHLDSEIKGIRKAHQDEYPKLKPELEKYFIDKDKKAVTSLILDAFIDMEDLIETKGLKPKDATNTEGPRVGGAPPDLESGQGFRPTPKGCVETGVKEVASQAGVQDQTPLSVEQSPTPQERGNPEPERPERRSVGTTGGEPSVDSALVVDSQTASPVPNQPQ